LDANLIATIGAGVVAVLVSFLLNRYYFLKSFRIGSANERTGNARKEVVRLLSNSVNNDDKVQIEFPLIESWIKSKYRENKVDYSPATELPIIIDDLITTISDDLFIPPPKRAALQENALTLKRMIEKRESNLEDELEEWRESSIPRIMFKSFAIAYWTFVAGFLAILGSMLILIQFKLPISTNFTELLSLITLFGIIMGFIRYRALKAKRDKSSMNLRRILEDKSADAIRKSVPRVELERNLLSPNGNLIKVDLVITSNGDKIPVEIKHDQVRETTIEKITKAMNELNSNRGILITSSKVSKQMMERASSKNVIVVENVTSEEDIIRALENTFN